MTGKLIVLEGLSAAGKKTQTCRLLESLKNAGKKASSFSFPDYDSPVGRLIAEYLAGIWGKKEDLIQTAVLLYALDRYQNASRIRQALNKNDFVLLDRYSPANYAFQGALMKNEEEKRKLWQWIDQVESSLPQADLVVFLDVPRSVTQTNYASRDVKNPLTQNGQKQDIHEADSAFESRVHQNYLQLARERGWTVINCVESGKLLPPEKVHEKVKAALKNKGYS